MGQTGPLAEFAGYGNLAAAIAGFYEITGWPDRPPAGPFGAYTDYVAPRYGLAVLLAALDHRRRTGQGQHIDLSQAEAAIHFLAPAILDYTVNGRVLGREGNADPHMAPHGVYPCTGEDRWVAIACATDSQWTALTELMGRPDLAADPALATAQARLRRRVEVDQAVATWTATLDPVRAAELCQQAGVPAYAVQTSPDCWTDPQLQARNHFRPVEHAQFGTVTVEGPRVRLSQTPGHVTKAGPTIGQDTYTVLSEILGYDEGRIGDLYAAEALE
jgi:crotonobetainyl-CoA:carnitine CoA-transferase CaiB-like acyl-CoA transferase